MKDWVDRWGGLSFLITLWLLSRMFFGFEIATICLLATILWELKSLKA